jgi:hypothetical protein
MPDENNSQTPSTNPGHQTLTPTPDTPPVVQRVVPDCGKPEAEKEKQASGKPMEKLHPIHHAAFWVQLGLGVIGIAAILIYWGQLCEMRKTAKLTQDSVTNADRNFRIDERAWMAFGFKDQGSITLTFNKSFLVPVELRNTGKTPAKNIHGVVVVGVFKKGEPLDFTYTFGHAHYGVQAGAVFPNGSIVESFEAIKHGQEHAEAIIFTPSLKDELFNARSFIVTYGRIDYNDIFGREHWTTYCRYVLHPELISDECTRYNNADSN